jgi:lipoprotein-anchoring transpeptidase ErfK/SrfK
MVGTVEGFAQGGMAGLASAAGNDRAPAYLPRFMAGGPGNPLGARALYLGETVYRIHGTNQPQTIGQSVSSGCFRLVNPDVVDLFDRVPVGTKVVVRQTPEM